MRRTVTWLLAAVCCWAGLVESAVAGERFIGQVGGGGEKCVAVMLDITIDGGRIVGGGTIVVRSWTPITVSGTRAGDDVRFLIEHRANVGDDRLQRIPMLGKFSAADRLEVWQDGNSLTCNPGRRGVLLRQ